MSLFKSITALPGLDKRVWWVAFALIIIGSLLLAGIGYRHGLPYVDEGDEVTGYAFGRAYFDSTWSMWQPGQPPGEFVVSAFVQQTQIALGDPWINVAATVEILRVISVLCQVGCVALTMLLGRQLAGPLAGLAAGGFWMVLPLANLYAKYATQNLWVTVFFVAAVVAGIEGWSRKSLGWLFFSLVLAIIATLFKWQAAAALGIPGLACLTFWRTDRRKMIAAMIFYVIIIAAFSYWVVFIHKALEGSYYYYVVPSQTPTPANTLANLLVMMFKEGQPVIYGVLPILGLILTALIPVVRKRVYGEMGLWSFVPVFIVYCIILSVYGAPVFDRQYLPAMPLLAALAGVGLVALIAVCQQVFAEKPRTARVLVAALTIIAVLLTFGMGLQTFGTDLTKLQPDQHNDIATWTSTTAASDAVVILNSNLELSVEPLYGYRGPTVNKPYNNVMAVNLPSNQLNAQTLNAQNIRYLVSTLGFDPQKVDVPLTRLIAEPGKGSQNLPGWIGWYVGPLPKVNDNPLVTFGGELALRGYSLSSPTVCQGHPLALQFVWSAVKQPTRYYSVYVHFYSDQTHELGAPLNGADLTKQTRPTVSWTNPNEIMVGTPWSWDIPTSVQPGDYQMWVGIYDPATGTRLKLPDGTDHFVLTHVKVEDCSSALDF